MSLNGTNTSDLYYVDKLAHSLNDYSVQNNESLRGHCTNERKVRKKVRRDVI